MRINNHATPEFFNATLAWARRWPSVVTVGVSFLALLIAGKLIRFGGNWGALLGIAVVAWPIWHFRVERLHVARRAHLEEISLPDTRLRRLFWRGSISAGWQAIPAFGCGLLLLLLTYSLKLGHWTLVVADVALLVYLMHRHESHSLLLDVKPAHRRSVARRWWFFVNTAALALAFATLEYFHYGMPDTQNIPWRNVALGTFDNSISTNSGFLFSGWIALAATAEQLIRHVMLIYIKTMPETWMRAAAWFCVALYFSASTWLLSRYFLGTHSLAEQFGWLPANTAVEHGMPPAAHESESEESTVWPRWTRRAPKEFLVVTLGFVLVLVASGDSINGFSRSQEKWMRRAVGMGALLTDPCRRHVGNTANSIVLVRRRLDEAEKQALIEAKRTIHEATDSAFSQARAGVNPFLDWYYSMAGDATRFAAMFTDSASDQVHAVVNKRFIAPITGLEESVSQRVSERVGQVFGGALRKLETDLQQEVDAQPCLRFKLNLPQLVTTRDKIRWASTTAVSLAILGVVNRRATLTAVAFAERTAIRATGRAIAKASVNKAGKLLFPVAEGTAVCAMFLGFPPLALVCEGGVLVVTLFGGEYVSLKLDEVFNRENMRKKMIDDLNQEQAEVEKNLYSQVEQMLTTEVGRMRYEVNKTFVPARDGA